MVGAIGLWIIVAPPQAVAQDTQLLISAAPYKAERSDDGTTTLKVTGSNLSDHEVELGLTTDGGACAYAVGEPTLAPYTTGDVAFTMSCDAGSQPRTATINAAFVSAAGAPTPAGIPVRFTVGPKTESDWLVLRWFLLGIPVAAFGVLVPYSFWVFHPMGNKRKLRPAGPLSPTPGNSPRWFHLGRRLPGITSDWNFKDNWSSNVGLAAAIFTAVIASPDSLERILGDDAAGPLAVVTVAAAFSAALIGTGPLWLVICKRRYPDDPAARMNTVGGVLLAGFVVLFANAGLVFTVAFLLDLPAAWYLGWAAIGLLVLYTARSIPMTLARGAHGDSTQSVSAMP
jgi:hypothetical protein